ncbi:MAG: ATP-binding protein [Bacillota bacterium]
MSVTYHYQMGLSREGGGDSGVGNRQFKMLPEYMSDTAHRGRIVFVGLTNRPDLIDSALKRSGRFDRIVPILPPEEEQRAAIFTAIFKRYAIRHSLGPGDLKAVAGTTEHYTGADLEAVVLKAFEVSQNRGALEVTKADLEHVVSMYRLNKASQEDYIRLALRECKFIDDLPPKYRDSAKREPDRGLDTPRGVPRRRRE